MASTSLIKINNCSITINPLFTHCSSDKIFITFNWASSNLFRVWAALFETQCVNQLLEGIRMCAWRLRVSDKQKKGDQMSGLKIRIAQHRSNIDTYSSSLYTLWQTGKLSQMACSLVIARQCSAKYWYEPKYRYRDDITLYRNRLTWGVWMIFKVVNPRDVKFVVVVRSYNNA